jgi:hypothetical protein
MEKAALNGEESLVAELGPPGRSTPFWAPEAAKFILEATRKSSLNDRR